MSEELAVGNVLLRQRRLSADEKIGRRYDVVFAALSWESRGTSAFSQLADTTIGIVILKFKSRSPAAEAAKEDQLTALKALLPSITVKELDLSTEAQKNYGALRKWLYDLYSSKGRPISVLADITCIPKTYILFLIGLGFSEELFARFDCLYSPGKYDLGSPTSVPLPTVAGPRGLLSEGEWHSHQIPYLEAGDYISGDTDLLVSLGGELGLSLPFIERFEPHRLGLIFIADSIPGNLDSMLGSERLAYEELLREPNVERKEVLLCDAISVARHAVEFQANSAAKGTTAMAIGSKPHAIALAVAALSSPKMEVVCRMPASYRLVDVTAVGEVMLYEIEDRFDPTSYIAFP